MYKSYILCLLLLLSSPAHSADTHKAATFEDGAVMVQASDSLGEQEVTVTSHALKMVHKRDGVTLIARAPLWNVVLYNLKGRTYYQSPLASWNGRVPIGDVIQREPNLTARAGAPGVVNGLKAMHTIIDEKRPIHARRGADYWYTTEFHAPQALCSIIQKDYAVPQANGFPLLYVHIQGGDKEDSLKTIKLERKKIPLSTFAIPAGLSPVNGTQLVMYAGDQIRSDFMKDIVDGMSRK